MQPVTATTRRVDGRNLRKRNLSGRRGPRRSPRNRRRAGSLVPLPPVARPDAGALPRRQKFLLGDRIQGTALDILESLVEATYTRQRESHLARANLGIEKLRFLVRLAMDLEYLDPRRYEHAARALDETGRKVGAWRKIHRARSGG